MSVASGLLALALLGSDGSGVGTGSSDSPISYQIKFVEMKGLDWRGQAHDQLTVVARQGRATIWTMRRDAASTMAKSFEKTEAAPRVTCNPETPAVVRLGSGRAIVADLKRVADGPHDRATVVAYQPELGEANDWTKVTLSGRCMDQGVLAKVCVEDCKVSAVHKVTVKESVAAGKGGKPAELQAEYQVPEVVSGHAEGEWIVPKDGVLVVSLGAFTMADDQGKAVTRERLALIEAKPAPSDPATTKASFKQPSPSPLGTMRTVVGPATIHLPPNYQPPAPIGRSLLMPKDAVRVVEAPVALAPAMPMPPTRTLPTPLAADGTVVELPPLPDEPADEVDASAEPRPAPQTRVKAAPVPKPEAAKSDDLAKASDEDEDCCILPKKDVASTVPTFLRPLTTASAEKACCDASSHSADDNLNKLSLDAAIRSALMASEAIRVGEIMPGTPSKDGVVVCSSPTGQDPKAVKKDAAALARAVEQNFWALHHASIRQWSSETAVDLGEQILKREIARREAGASNAPNITEVQEQLERFRLDLIDSTSQKITAESALRRVAGICPKDRRQVVGITNPRTSPTPMGWHASLAALKAARGETTSACSGGVCPISAAKAAVCCDDKAADCCDDVAPCCAAESKEKAALHELEECRLAASDHSTSDLARAVLNIDTCYKLYTTATNLKKAALVRLDAQRAYYEQGAITIDRYLEALRNWSNAVAQEADFLCRYNVALAARDEMLGTLLERHNVAIADPSKAEAKSRDADAVRTSHESKEIHGRLSFMVGAVAPATDIEHAIRIPLGSLLSIEIRTLPPGSTLKDGMIQHAK